MVNKHKGLKASIISIDKDSTLSISTDSKKTSLCINNNDDFETLFTLSGLNHNQLHEMNELVKILNQ